MTFVNLSPFWRHRDAVAAFGTSYMMGSGSQGVLPTVNLVFQPFIAQEIPSNT